MGKERLEDFIDDFALLIEAGFVAVKQLDETSASRLFHAAQAMNPMSTAPQIGLGYIALNKLEVKEATRIYEDVLKKEPDNYLAQTFLGMCLLLTKAKRKKGKKMIEEAKAKSNDPTVKNLCDISLTWAEKDLEKKNIPFFAVDRDTEEEE
ncbi:MAG: SctF chaperone SctG [Chlamydiales bacterium]|nr:SctF chaperone SctG [Chlamydiia bacterium]MCP5507012.1 SctF chaperone SctG [Chlamydiales bacterium]